MKDFKELLENTSDAMQRAVVTTCFPCQLAAAWFTKFGIEYRAEDVLRLGRMINNEFRQSTEQPARLEKVVKK